MKAEKKRSGTKARIRAMKEKESRRIGTAVFLALILIVIVFSAYFTYSYLSQPPTQAINPSAQPKAAIVDHLSLTVPNQTFKQTATNILEQANYTVDYYPSESVTVDFYRTLPKHGYRLLILRVHSSAAVFQGTNFTEAPVCLFTSENYSSSSHVWEQLTDQLVIASYAMPQPPYYFGILPKFVTSSMSISGKFNKTTVIMMGCEGLNNTKMAEAFITIGAKAYIGWTKSVSASHTDRAIICLLQQLIQENQTINQAVENTMKKVGPDPAENSLLDYYPIEAGDQTIENVT